MITLLTLWLESKSKPGLPWETIYWGTTTLDLVGMWMTYEIAELFFS